MMTEAQARGEQERGQRSREERDGARGRGASARGLGCGERKRRCRMPSAAARGRRRMGRAAERNMWVGALAFLVLLGVGGRSEGGQGVRRAESVAVVVVVPRWHAGAGGFATTLLSSALVDV